MRGDWDSGGVLPTSAWAAQIGMEEIPSALAGLVALQAVLVARLANSKSEIGMPRLAPPPDRLLTVEEAAQRLVVTPRWVYRHSSELPFTRRLSRRALRFSELGLERWLAGRKA